MKKVSLIFICENCKKEVTVSGPIGTKNRNHCPFCLFSKHLDKKISGDRKEKCHQLMTPLALTFKFEGKNKYGEKKQGELMLVHLCQKCGNISINRIAGDDDNDQIISVYKSSFKLKQNILDNLKKAGITILTDENLPEIKRQILGIK